MMISLITPTSGSLAFSIVGGTVIGIADGLQHNQFANLRFGSQCVLKSFMLSLTISAVAHSVFSTLVSIAKNRNPEMFAISCVAFLLNSVDIFGALQKCEHIFEHFMTSFL